MVLQISAKKVAYTGLTGYHSVSICTNTSRSRDL